MPNIAQSIELMLKSEGFNFYTRNKVITTRWLDPSHGGLNLGFPQND